MEERKYAGLIECGASTTSNWTDKNSGFKGFHIKKVLVKENMNGVALDGYADAEVVSDINSIMNDQTIELVVFSGAAESDLVLVAEAIGAGKQVRVL
jgi:hypothetical protein